MKYYKFICKYYKLICKDYKPIFFVIVIIGFIAIFLKLYLTGFELVHILTAIIESVSVLLVIIIFEKVFKPKDYKQAIIDVFKALEFKYPFINVDDKTRLFIKPVNGKDAVKTFEYDEGKDSISFYMSYKTFRYLDYDISPKDENHNDKLDKLVSSTYRYLIERYGNHMFSFEMVYKSSKNDVDTIKISTKDKGTPEFFEKQIKDLCGDIIKFLEGKSLEKK